MHETIIRGGGPIVGSNVNLLLVFLEGITSFSSPCVIPMIPLYMAYLAGNARNVDEAGNTTYKRSTVLFHTICFVAGVSVSFFILGLGFSALGSLVKENRDMIARIGGIIIILLGLSQLGVLRLGFLNKEFRLSKSHSKKKVNPISAFVMGFVFSFAWTPCVGPALASVLILASNASSVFEGNLLVLVYAVGFVIPFIGLGLFTSEVLNFIKKNANLMKYIVKIGGVILIIMGLMLALGTFGRFEAMFNSLGTSIEANKDSGSGPSKDDSKENGPKNEDSSDQSSENSDKEDTKKIPMMPIKLEDQDGNMVDVSQFKGKVIFINFFATWCPPCRAEIPDIEAVYKANGYNKKDVVVVGVASPGQQREQDLEGVKKFIKDHKISYPVLMDKRGEIFRQYQVYSLPTSFFIDKDLNIYAYIEGGINRETMDQAINDTKSGKVYN